jgi:hypothetical protein
MSGSMKPGLAPGSLLVGVVQFTKGPGDGMVELSSFTASSPARIREQKSQDF